MSGVNPAARHSHQPKGFASIQPDRVEVDLPHQADAAAARDSVSQFAAVQVRSLRSQHFGQGNGVIPGVAPILAPG